MARKFVMVNGQKITTYNGNPHLKAVNNPIQFTQAQAEEYIKCATDVEYFCSKYVKIVSLDEGIVGFDMRDYQKKMVKLYSQERFTITLASRQIGKSITVLSGFLLHEILFKDNQTCAVLANKGSLARDQLAKLKMSYELLPLWMQQGIVEWNKGFISLENGSNVVAAATSASSVRGNSYNCVVLDEFAHVETNLQEEFFESTYPTLSSGKTTKLIIISTPKGMNLFHKIWVEASEGRNEFKTCRVDWWEVPGRDEKWKQETLRNIGERKFDQEYGNEFVGSDATLISGAKLRSLAWRTPLLENTDGFRVYDEPEKDRTYVITVDTAEGIGQDSHAISVFDVSSVPYKQVATFNNNEMSIYIFPSIVHNIALKYNEAMVLVEIMSTGRQIVDSLRLDLEYENIVMVDSNLKKGQSIGGGFKKTATFGMKTNKATKAIGCSNLKSLVEHDKLILQDHKTISELFTFIEHNGTYKAEEGQHDDMAMTLVLFSWMTAQKYFTELTDIEVRKSFLDQLKEDTYEEITPVGFINNGIEDDRYTVGDDGNWKSVSF